MGYNSMKAKGEVLETREKTQFKDRIIELKKSIDAYDTLGTMLHQNIDQEWMKTKRNLLKKAEVAEAEALFLYCLKMGEESDVTAETLCSRAREQLETDIFESMFQPLKETVEKAETHKQYK